MRAKPVITWFGETMARQAICMRATYGIGRQESQRKAAARKFPRDYDFGQKARALNIYT